MKKRKPPKASLVKGRNCFRAYGINPSTLERKAFYGDTPEEAESAAEASYLPQVERHTLADYYLRSYLPTVEHRSTNWQNQIAWAMDLHVLPEFGDKFLGEIKRPELQRFFNRLLKKMKTSSVDKVKIVLSGVFNLAVADEVITTNPCRYVKLPTPEEPEKIALTYDQLARLYHHAKPELRVILQLCACAGGLRIGEACGTSRMQLTSDDVLHVRQQVLQLPGGAELTKTLKTPQTRRDLPLPADLADAIRKESGNRLYLAGTSSGKFQLPNNVTEDLQEACKKAGIPIITPHELRHTFISLLENEIEAPAAVVAALAGKKDNRVTAGYSHTHQVQMKKWLSAHFSAFRKALEKLKSESQTASQEVISQVQNRFKLTLWCAGKDSNLHAL